MTWHTARHADFGELCLRKLVFGLARASKNIEEDQVQRGNDHERQQRGEDQTERQCDRHRDHEFCLETGLEHQRCEAGGCRQRGEEDRSEAEFRAVDTRLEVTHPAADSLVNEFDENQRVVHQDAAQSHHADHAEDGQRVVRDQVADDGS